MLRVSKKRHTHHLAVLVAVIALTILLFVLGTGVALAWTDISDSQWVATYGVTSTQVATVAAGYANGTFKPLLAVDRGQFAKMVVDGFGMATASPASPTFTDVPTTNFFYRWIEGGVDAGIISGFGDGTYRPTSVVSRQQANSILGLYLAQRELSLRGHIAGDDGNYASLNAWYSAEGVEVLAQFADSANVASIHAPATAYLVFHDVVRGSASGGGVYLRPGSNLTRAQAVALILRVRAVSFSTALPTITLVNPASGPAVGGNSVVITGTNFTGATVVKFGAVAAPSYVVNSATQITAVAPAGTTGTTVDVGVTTPAGTSAIVAADKYGYGTPTVTLLAPAAGVAAGGTSVVITGTGFSGVTAVKFGLVNATSYVVNSPTQITAVAPAGTAGTTVDVTVTATASTSAASAASKYSYGAPTVTVLAPAAGAAASGTSVVITGTGFTGLSGAAAVKFGLTNATSYVVNSPTQITAVAPAGTTGTTVDVTVTTPAGTSAISVLASKYSYGVPTVALLDPVGGPAAGGNAVVITGTGFTGLSGAAAVKFGLTNATSYVVNSPTQITAIAPAGTPGAVVDVTVVNPVGASGIAGTGNDYTYGVPTVLALAPNIGTTAGSTAVTISGTNFVAGATVAFGTGFPATSVVVVNSTTITCVSPAHAAGVVDVVVTTPAGPSSIVGAGNDYTYVSYTADVALALTTPAPGVGNTITGGGATKTVTVNVVNATASVVLTGTKLVGQAVVLGGANASDVIAAGTGTAPIYTVNTSSVSATGGSKVFTLTVSETGKADIVYTVTVTVAAPYTADMTLALTTPAPDSSNTIAGGGATKTVTVNVANATSSVVLTGAKTAGQTVAIGGANAANVTAGGSATVPTYTINTSSVSALGGSKVFTLTVSEAGKASIVYTATVTVAGPTADMALVLTAPAPGAGNTITGGGATKTVTVNVVNATASVVLTGTKTAGQTVAIGGTNGGDVAAGGTTTAPTYTVNTSSVSAAGGSKTFTLTVGETGKGDIVYTVTVTVAQPFTADVTFALTSPTGTGNTITGGGATKTVTVNVVNATSSVVLTGAKTAGQTVAIGGTNGGDVAAGGTTTAPIYTVNTSSVSAAGGSKTFTLTVSEAARADIVYTLTVNVAIPYTANITLALTTPAPGVGNTITGGGAVRSVQVNVVNTTASVVLTGTKLVGQAVVLGGANASDVIATGTGTAPIYTVNTSTVAAAGGSKVFTFTVSETGKADIVYTVTVTVAGP